MICPYCNTTSDIEGLDPDNVESHLIILKNKDGKMHCHGPIDSPDEIKELCTAALDQIDGNKLEKQIEIFKDINGKIVIKSNRLHDTEEVKKYILELAHRYGISVEEDQ